jgi:hypothetical protein
MSATKRFTDLGEVLAIALGTLGLQQSIVPDAPRVRRVARLPSKLVLPLLLLLLCHRLVHPMF